MWCVKKKTHPKVQNMVRPISQLHGRQIPDYVVRSHWFIVQCITGHSIVMYHNTLSNNASIDIIIRFYIIVVPFSNELINSDICSTTSLVVCHTSTLYKFMFSPIVEPLFIQYD